MLLKDKVAIVTGSDGGIGRSPAGELILPVVTPENIDELYPPEPVAR